MRSDSITIIAFVDQNRTGVDVLSARRTGNIGGTILPTLEVDLLFFILEQIVLLFVAPLMIGVLLWKAYKNPEFWLKFRRMDWVYALVRTPLMQLKQVAVPLKNIGENGEFKIFGDRRYYWSEKDKTGRSTVFTWRHKKSANLYDWKDPYPQTWVPGNSLTSMTDPKTLDDLNELKAFKMMLNADSMTRLMRIALVVSVVGIIAVAGVGFAVFTQSSNIAHLSCVLGANGNSTMVALCR